jgi:hypothetical protein
MDGITIIMIRHAVQSQFSRTDIHMDAEIPTETDQ